MTTLFSGFQSQMTKNETLDCLEVVTKICPIQSQTISEIILFKCRHAVSSSFGGDIFIVPKTE